MPGPRTKTTGLCLATALPGPTHGADCCIVALLKSSSHSSCRIDHASIRELAMDGHHFDTLPRLVDSRLSRRAGLGLLAAVAMIGGSSSASEAGKKKKDKKQEKITICSQGQ